MKKVRPKVFMGREFHGSFEVDPFNDVIVFGDAINSSPEIPLFEGILLAQFESLSLYLDAFLE